VESGGELPRSLQERTNKGFYSENLLVVGRRRSSKIPAAQSWLVKFDHWPDAGAPSLAGARVMCLRRLQLRLDWKGSGHPSIVFLIFLVDVF
jgi:hypothetical protein